jgi:hypothetical protein
LRFFIWGLPRSVGPAVRGAGPGDTACYAGQNQRVVASWRWDLRERNIDSNMKMRECECEGVLVTELYQVSLLDVLVTELYQVSLLDVMQCRAAMR